MSGRSRERGLTLVELLVYLMMVSGFTVTVVGADQLARRMYRRDGALIQGLQASNDVFRALQMDFDTSETARIEADGATLGVARYRFDREDRTVSRQGRVLTGAVSGFMVEADKSNPRLFHVTLSARGVPQPESAKQVESGGRVYRRSFVLAGVGTALERPTPERRSGDGF